ncbi:MAG: sensor histidine kinase [Promethearchaeota archaeon]
MIDYYVIHLATTIVIIFATFIFATVCLKRRYLISWLIAYISASSSEVFRLFSQVQYDTFEAISIIFSALSVTSFIIAVSHEYYLTFSKKSTTQAIPIVLLFFQQQFTSIGLQSIIAFLLFIAIFLDIKIYLKKRTPTHAFMCFILFSGLLQVISSILRDNGISGAEELLEFSRIVMATVMLITGIIAIIEYRLVSSEKRYRLAYNRAEFYKDLFVHDINNILQNLEFSLEIISNEMEKQNIKENINELVRLAKAQVNRGAELGLNVRRLSDLELGKIDNTPLVVHRILNNAIKYVKSRFPYKNVNISTNPDEGKYSVNASELLYDVFRILLNNAIRYNDNTEIEIIIKISHEIQEKINYIRIEIMDNGIGMPDGLKENSFYNIYEKPKSFIRIGLGLLLVRETVQSFNGNVWAEDRVNGDYTKGTKIILQIPAVLEF